MQEICWATVGSLTCLWHTCTGRGLLVQSHLSSYKLGKKSTVNLMRNSIGGEPAIYVQRSVDLYQLIFRKWSENIWFSSKSVLFLQEDNYYPHTSIQILFWDAIYTFGEPLLTRWPFNKLREKALHITMDHIHYEDECSRYITIGCIEKVTHLQSNSKKEIQYSKIFAYYTWSLIFGHLYHWTGTAIRYAGLLGWRSQWGLF